MYETFQSFPRYYYSTIFILLNFINLYVYVYARDSMKKFIDQITQKTITYTDDDAFIIKWKSTPTSKKKIKKIFQGNQLEDAVKEFYSMVIRKGAFKYLYHVPHDRYGQEGDLVFRMKGEATVIPTDNLRLKSIHVKSNYKVESIGTLTKCPKTLADLLAREDFTAYPASISRWTNSKLFYCLLAHYLDLSREEKLNILKSGEKSLISHKQISGFDLDFENKIKVDVVTKDDLL